MNLASRLVGTWISDNGRTEWELRRNLGAKHPKTVKYRSNPYALILHYQRESVIYYHRDMTCSARYRILAADENSVITEVAPSGLNEQKLWHIHFLTPKSYWVSVDLDWGLSYREFFEKMHADPDDDIRRFYARTPLFFIN
jgi:hypothetical protein